VSALRAMIERSGTRAARSEAGHAAIPTVAERCGLCSAPVPEQHRHLFDLTRRELVCACRACALLFDRDGAGDEGRHWRLVPDRCLALSELKLDDLAWRSLGLPVELAFVVRRESGEVSAFYPSPAGATECTVELLSWGAIEAENPRLASMRADVEALLIDRTGEHLRAFLVGVDECYRLVAVIRTHWRGFGGGEQVWREIEHFFQSLSARAQTVT
jgi:uncharacterized cysteine cluster protein YcgN (CxxCxxCC family)